MAQRTLSTQADLYCPRSQITVNPFKKQKNWLNMFDLQLPVSFTHYLQTSQQETIFMNTQDASLLSNTV